MIILLRKKSVKWLVALAAAIIIVSVFGSGRSHQMENPAESEPASAVMAPVAKETLTEAKPEALEPAPEAEPTEIAPTEPAPAEPEAERVDEPLDAAAPAVDDAADKVIALRMERSQNRAQQQAQLEAIVANGEVSEETKARAEEKLLKLGETSAMELETETLLKTKGYEQSVVMIDASRATVYITCELAAEDYDKIGDLVQASTNFSLEQIIIIPK